MRQADPEEIPSGFGGGENVYAELTAPNGVAYLIPPGVDPLELGVISRPGHYYLMPVEPGDRELRDEAVDLIVSAEQARAQREILMRSYRALCELMPRDTASLHASVQAFSERGVGHPIFGRIRAAALETWRAMALGDRLRDDDERARWHAGVGLRVARAMRDECKLRPLDRTSFLALRGRAGAECFWDVIVHRAQQGDYGDAIVRVLARMALSPNGALPLDCLLRVLPGVESIEIFFLLIRQTGDGIAARLAAWLKRESIGSTPDGAGLAIRVIFFIDAMAHVDPDTAAHVDTHALIQSITCEPATSPERELRVRYRVLAGDPEACAFAERDPHYLSAAEGAILRWGAAMSLTLADVVAALPLVSESPS